VQNTEIFFHWGSHISVCIYYKHATVVLRLQWKESVVLPNKHAENVRWVIQCAPLTLHARLNTNTRKMLQQECRRFSNLTPLKRWHAGPVLCSTTSLYEVEFNFSRLLNFNTNSLFAVLANINTLQLCIIKALIL